MNTKLFFGLAMAMAVTACFADPPTYVSKNASGTSTATVIFPSSASSSVRVVTAVGSSDKAGSVFSFRTGTTPYVIGSSNAAGTTISLTRTNGLAANDVLVIEKADGTTATGTIQAFANSTNVTLAATSGVITIPGDQVYLMSAATTVGIGATSNKVYSGEALYVGNRGRPVRVVVDGTSYCAIDTVSARYDQ